MDADLFTQNLFMPLPSDSWLLFNSIRFGFFTQTDRQTDRGGENCTRGEQRETQDRKAKRHYSDILLKTILSFSVLEVTWRENGTEVPMPLIISKTYCKLSLI